MPKEKLRALLEELHQELASAENVDAESQALLEQVAGDIRNLVDVEAADGDSHGSAASRAQDAALRFESEHPRLAGVLNQLVDALNKLGI